MKTVDSYAKGLAPAVQVVLVASLILVFFAGIQLFVFTEYTDRFFAWTISSPLSAAFLGAAFWGTIPAFLALWTTRGLRWANARAGALGVIVFGTATLIATLLHLDKFYMNAITGWVWLIVYIVVPVSGVIVTVLQSRRPEAPQPPVAPMRSWARGVLFALGGFLLLYGAGLFILPDSVGNTWPWGLTPLTARAIAAWLLGNGAVALAVARDGDWNNAQFLTATMVVMALLQFAALVRYPPEMTWAASIWVYAVVLFIMIGLGAYGFITARRATR
ncbi:MAG: hypothetical protein EPO32_05715 [Anaerolineae bacterium]|nr:MAG: hypothetical protein EPO32_05715 [Anaerolineae bacterium]